MLQIITEHPCHDNKEFPLKQLKLLCTAACIVNEQFHIYELYDDVEHTQRRQQFITFSFFKVIISKERRFIKSYFSFDLIFFSTKLYNKEIQSKTLHRTP